MKSELNKQRIHIWDGRAITTALFLAAIIEGLAIAPLVIFGMGHAGPNGGGLGYLSLFLNIIGVGIAANIMDETRNFSWLSFYLITFLTQTALFSYMFFVLIRIRKVKPENSLKLIP